MKDLFLISTQIHLFSHEPRAHRVHIQIKSTFLFLICIFIRSNECTASVRYFLYAFLQESFLNDCNNLGLSIWLSLHVLFVSLFPFFLGSHNRKYAFTGMNEAALLSARLVSSPLALFSRKVPDMFYLKCFSFIYFSYFTFLFSSYMILKFFTSQIRYRFHSIFPLILIIFLFFYFRELV